MALLKQIQEFNKAVLEYSKAVDSTKYVNVDNANDTFSTFEEALSRKLDLAKYVKSNPKEQQLEKIKIQLFGSTTIEAENIKELKNFFNNIEIIKGRASKKKASTNTEYTKEVQAINNSLVAERKKEPNSQAVKDLLVKRLEIQNKYGIKPRIRK